MTKYTPYPPLTEWACGGRLCHGGADGTALAGVDIGHDPDLTSGILDLITNRLDLFSGGFLQLGRVTDGSII